MSFRRLIARSGRDAPGDRPPAEDPLMAEADPADRAIVEQAVRYSMTGAPRMLALVDAVRYCIARGVPGAFAECGVWLGGSVLAMILTLQDLGVSDRDIYLYDTFEGMTAPTKEDVSAFDPPALATWQQAQADSHRPWQELFDADAFNEDGVRETVLQTGYPSERVHFVRGPVEETVPGTAPERIALLRLDTDWYESTRHELIHLFPRLVSSGVLIVDDYGHWQGARQAVDEYFSNEHAPLLLTRIDYTARIAVKQ
jgi:O-methyltransferase